jgi:hypothetical protein
MNPINEELRHDEINYLKRDGAGARPKLPSRPGDIFL